MHRDLPVACVLALLAGPVALACETCRPAVRAGIFNGLFAYRLAFTLLPFAVVLLAVAVVHVCVRPRRTAPRRLTSIRGGRESA